MKDGRATATVLAALAIFVTGFSCSARADEDPDQRWGISIWGVSYHIDQEKCVKCDACREQAPYAIAVVEEFGP